MIVVFGSANVDLVFALARLPRAGETVLCPRYRAAPGGKGLNQAIAAARAGARVAMAGAVGEDAFAETALAALDEAGVGRADMARVRAPTGLAAVWVGPDGDNRIAVASGANAHARAHTVPDAALGPETWLLLQMEVPPAENLALARRAKARGAGVVLNLAPARPPPEGLLAAVDWIVVNELEATMLAEAEGVGARDPGAAAQKLALRCAGGVVVSLGAAGAAAYTAADAIGVGALPITPVDTTGAGDAFVGVFAAALDSGAGVPEALHRASVAGSLACLAAGAAPSLPTRPEIERHLGALAPPRPLNRTG